MRSETRCPWLARHQREALRRLTEILDSHRGAILADEPGLGKTRVAAAVAAACHLRGSCVDVVVPASLRAYWASVMSSFGVPGNVVSHTSLAGGLPVREDDRERLVIVDEAHRFRNPRTKRYRGLARLTVNARVLLVTATPMCNSPADLLSLLKLIAPDDELASSGVSSMVGSFAAGGDELGVVMHELIVRHSVAQTGVHVGRRRDVSVEYEPLPNRREVASQIGRLTFPWVHPAVSRNLLLLLLERRLESSVAALAATIRRMSRVCGRARHLSRRGASLSATELRAVFGDPDSPWFQDLLFPEVWGARRGRNVDDEVFEQEAKRLDAVLSTLGDDPKPKLLVDVIRVRKESPGIVFTVSFDTAASLFDQLSGSLRCALLTGRRCEAGGRRRSVDGVVEAVSTGEVDLLIATDLGSEGLNLEAAGYLIHYDQPWNPAVLEQRHGRICRIGQRREWVEAIQLISEGCRSHRIVSGKRAANERIWTIGSREPMGRNDASYSGWKPPARVESGLGQVVLVRRLRERALSTGEAVELLSARYRTGVEQMIEQAAAEGLSADEVKDLLRVLRTERAMVPGLERFRGI